MSRAANVIGKVKLQGQVELQSPLLIGAGENDNFTDTLVLKNKEGKPYIPGTSLAGVLRTLDTAIEKYFGVFKNDDRAMEGDPAGEQKMQSCLVIGDIVLENAKYTIRDSVALEPVLGVGKKGAKFDYEAVERGATGKFTIEATIRGFQADYREDITSCVRLIGQRMLTGIFMGANTTNGFGKLVAKAATVELAEYDFTKPADVKAWLLKKAPAKTETLKAESSVSPKDFVFEGDFALTSSLIVRKAESEKIANAQLRSGDKFVIPGTSLKGVLRNQAYNICKALNKSPEGILESIFGCAGNEKDGIKGQKGRLIAEETYLQANVKAYPQTRNKIDRFTGGTIDSALFTEMPIWQEKPDQPSLKLRVIIKDCQPWQAGLLLFIIKDLWTGVVALGGEKSIGRGTLNGINGVISYEGKQTSIIDHSDELKLEGHQAALESYAKAFAEYEG